MKRLNKFLSVFLALIMVISIIPMSTITASAETNDIQYVADMNSDGNISAVDSRIIMQIVSGLRTNEDFEGKGDINNDGQVSIVDARCILQVVAGIAEVDYSEFVPGNTPIESPELSLNSSNESVKVGDTITVEVLLPENSGLSALTADIIYDETCLKLTNMYNNSDFDGQSVVNKNYDTGKARITMATFETYETAGVICTLEFEVLKCDATQINIECREAVDDDYDVILVDTVSINIVVSENNEDDNQSGNDNEMGDGNVSFDITSNNDYLVAGDTITVDVVILENTGFSVLTMDIVFDSSILRAKSVSNNTFWGTYAIHDDKVRYTLASASEFRETGTVITIEFEVLKFDSCEINIEFDEVCDFYNKPILATSDSLHLYQESCDFLGHHFFSDWYIVKEPTIDETGVIERCCANCGEKETDICTFQSLYPGVCGDNLTWSYDENTATLRIIGTGDMYGYDSYNRPWLEYVDNIKSVIIEGATSIADGAFRDCVNLTEVTMSDSVTTMGCSVFADCDSLTEITIPGSIEKINDYAFFDCDSLENVIIENGVYTIGEDAFSSCISLTSITIPDSVTTIEWMGFAWCDNLTTVFLGNGIEAIGYAAFDGCKKLKNISLPDSLILIDESAFNGCASIESIVIPQYVTAIPNYIFSGCTSLSMVYYSDNVTTIGSSAFYGCTSLVSVNMYEADVKMESISLLDAWAPPENTTCVGVSAFDGCSNLKQVYLPGEITTIYYGAFEDCSNLKDVYYMNTKLQWKTVIIDEEGNAPLFSATIHFVDGEHAHNYTSIATPPTCTEQGYTTYTCECGESYIDNYTDALGHKYVAVEVIPATCQQEGKQYDMCETCGVSLSDIVTVPKTDHISGNWEIIIEATSTTDGKKVKKCNVCGTVVEEEIIPATGNNDLGYATDNNTGVSVEFPKSEYNGEVGINVEEVIDDSETIFQLVNSDGNIINSKPYNITMTVNGVETQPNGDVIVKVPLPEGFNPELSLVKHIDLTTGAVEDIESEYIDGYLVFKTNHFSIYVIVEECNYTFSIQSPSRTEIRNKDGIILHANVEGNAPAGSYVRWESSNGNFDKSADGSNLKIVAKNKGWTTFTAILCDADGNELARDSVEMYSKSGFFDKIGGFFRSLFGTTKVYDA